MIYLDTHAVVWLFEGRQDLFSQSGLAKIEASELFISPIVLLELQYLHEIGKTTVAASAIADYLRESIDLKVCQASFGLVMQESLFQAWTRDPFDRIIVAQAACKKAPLLTKDRTISKHYPKACW